MLSGFFIHLLNQKQMAKIIFFLWLLSGKVQPKLDKYGYQDYNEGRKLYVMGVDSFLYKGEIINYIRTNELVYNEDFSDKNGRLEIFEPIDTVVMSYNNVDMTFPVFKHKRRHYVIDNYFKTKIYLK